MSSELIKLSALYHTAILLATFSVSKKRYRFWYFSIPSNQIWSRTKTDVTFLGPTQTNCGHSQTDWQTFAINPHLIYKPTDRQHIVISQT